MVNLLRRKVVRATGFSNITAYQAKSYAFKTKPGELNGIQKILHYI